MEQTKKGWFSCLLTYAGAGKRRLTGSVILSVISVTAGLLPYYCVFQLIEAFSAGALREEGILTWCGLALGAYLVKILCFGFSTMLSHYAAYHILEGLRLRVADRFLHAPLGEVTAHSIGEIKNLMVDKIEDIEPPLAHMIPEGMGHLALPVVSLIALARIDWRLALASLATVPLSLVCMILTFRISGKNFDQYVQSNTAMNSTIVEYIEGIEVIKAFGRAGTSYDKYAKAITDYRTFVVKWLSSTWVTFKLAFALFPSTLLGTLPMCLWLGTGGAITAAEAALGVMLSMSMVTSLAKIEVFTNEIKQMQMTVEELQRYLDMPELPEPENRAELSRYDVALKNVRFSYSGQRADEVLHGVSLHLSQGSFTALVGPSGGGKSTVAKLIARFWDVTEGEITIGGVNIKNIPLFQLADTVSFVTQDNFLFRCSLKENIRLGNPSASDEDVYAAARAAQCEEFISKLPQGYDTPAGEAGKRLSGGEKQRIAALTRGKTLLVIAHRLSTIRNADNIVVLKSGEVIAQGRQEELLQTCPLYRQMWQAHIGAKDWAVSGKEAV